MAGRQPSVGHVAIIGILTRKVEPITDTSRPGTTTGGLPGPTARRRLVTAVAASSLGDGLVVVAFPLLALRSTTNALLISGLVVAARLPWLLVSLPAGAIVDRFDRRRVVGVVDLARAAIVAAVGAGAFLATLPIEALYAASFLVGAGETVVSAAVRSAIPLLSADDGVVATNGQVGAAQTAGAQFAGPALGGVAFAAAASLPFVGDAASYVVSALLLRSTLPGRDRAAPVATSLGADITTGLRWFLANRLLRVLAVVVTSFAFCQAMVLGVLVLYATRDLHLGAAAYGVLLAVAAVGDVAASLLARRVHGRLGPHATILLAGAGAAGGYLLLSSTSTAAIAALALALEAAATSLGNVATLSARHRTIPAERFGLVNNAFRMPVTGLIPLGALAGGTLVTLVGLHTTFAVAGLVQLAVVAATALPLRLVSSPPGAPPEPAGGLRPPAPG